MERTALNRKLETSKQRNDKNWTSSFRQKYIKITWVKAEVKARRP